MFPVPASANVRNNHQLIPRQQSYVLDRKLVTIHSVDRDIRKWPESNNFEITLPQAITNVQSIRLTSVSMPAAYYSFSTKLQNTKFVFSMISVSAFVPSHIADAIVANSPYTVTIDEGFYTAEQLSNELQNKMNKVISDTVGVTYNRFVILNNEVGMKFVIGNRSDSFRLDFDVKPEFAYHCGEQVDVWQRYANWGLGANLGFKKEAYQSVASASALTVDWKAGAPEWLIPINSSPSTNVYYVTAPFVYDLYSNTTIYMEMDKFNSIDELVPYSERTNTTFNNDYNGSVNAAFAKIPLSVTPYGMSFEATGGVLSNFSHFDPPLERVQKLKFRFRDHNGLLFDFKEFPFNFTIEFNCLRNEAEREYVVRVPTLYYA